MFHIMIEWKNRKVVTNKTNLKVHHPMDVTRTPMATDHVPLNIDLFLLGKIHNYRTPKLYTNNICNQGGVKSILVVIFR